MPKYNLILNLPGFSIVKVSGYQPLILDLTYNRLPRCAHCTSKAVRAYKLYCNTCNRYGNQQFPGINKHQRSTWRLQAAVFHEHTHGISQKELANRFNKGKATIERWYHRHYQEQAREIMNTPCPVVLGIDEHFFSRK